MKTVVSERVLFFYNNISAGHTSLLQVYRSLNLKKSGMASRNNVIKKKQYTLLWISFAVVFGLLVFSGAFYLHVSSRCCPAPKCKVLIKRKTKKSDTKRHERFLEFCVRFASILKMSNWMKFWTTGTKYQPLEIINPSWWWHVLLGMACVRQFKGTFGSIAESISVKLPATLNIQLEYVFYTWGSTQSLWVPLFCHQVIISLWRRSVLQ